jgi:hemerythrin superfamily protein
MLKADHQQVRALFRHYATATDPDTQRQIVREVCAALALHAQLEETVFYPAFHAVTDEEGKLLVAEALAAHQAIPHMAAEESALFPFAAEDLADRLDHLRDAMLALKQQLTTSPRP